jgi:hypothetical protein
VRIAAAACLVASGLMAGGFATTSAVADPAPQSDGDAGKSANDSPGGGDRDHPKATDGAGTGKSDPPNSQQNRPRAGHQPDRTKSADSKPDSTKPRDADGMPRTVRDGKSEEGQPSVRPDNQPAKEGQGAADDPEGQGGTDKDAPVDPTATPQPSAVPEQPIDEDVPDCGDDGGNDKCGVPRPPWWPWPLPWDPDWHNGSDEQPGSGSGIGSSGTRPPSGRPGPPPAMQVPPHVGVQPDPGAVSAVPDVGVAAAALPLAPITLPVIVAPPLAGGAGPHAAPRISVPHAPHTSAGAPAARQEPPPAAVGHNGTPPPAPYRAGYSDYLRSAGISQVLVLAAPGVAGMLILTGAGGLVGYRQARAGHTVRTGGTARFVN